MNLRKFGQIIILTLLCASYSAWVQSERAAREQPFRNSSDLQLVRLGQAHSLWREEGTLFVDVRSRIDFEYGHIAGAVSLPYEEFEQLFPDLRPRLEKAQTLVVYCKSVDCGKSLWAALDMRRQGLAQTVIFPGGWNEWVTHQYPTRSLATR